MREKKVQNRRPKHDRDKTKASYTDSSEEVGRHEREASMGEGGVASCTRSRSRTHSGETQDHTQYLLVATRGGCDKNKRFSFGDMQGLVDKLPPISAGGTLWLDKLDQLTKGYKLAVGDFRAIAARCMNHSELRSLETDAATRAFGNEVPFIDIATDMGKAIRQKYPIVKGAAIPKFVWNPELSPREYLDRCKEQWTKHTGAHPNRGGTQEEWYRQAVLQGAPEKVKQLMEDNPDMQDCNSGMRERHLVHHLQRAGDEASREKEDLKELQKQLLKLQLGQARKDTTKDKREQNSKVMVATAGEQRDTPELYPVPDWEDSTPPYRQTQTQSYSVPPWNRERGRGGSYRGARGFGGSSGYATPTFPPDACYLCEQQGHWSRDCPHARQRQRGRGQYRGPSRSRGGPTRGR